MELDYGELVFEARVRGLSYDQYMEWMRKQAETDLGGLESEAAEKIEFTKLNLHRSGRIERNWQPGQELAAATAKLESPQLWMVLTEPWCGDSAQCLPAIRVLAESIPGVELKMILRDENLPIMDRFLTDGKRSIPRLVVFALDGPNANCVLGQWGPRPAAAQTVFDAAKKENLEKPQILERLHLWYGRDRGKALEAELLALMKEIAEG